MAIGRFGAAALLGGAVAYWLRGLQERAERAGRSVGAGAYGMDPVPPADGHLSPAELLARRAEETGRATGARMYGSGPRDS